MVLVGYLNVLRDAELSNGVIIRFCIPRRGVAARYVQLKSVIDVTE